MRRIGITGGIGAGKSIVLNYLQTACHCRIVQADELAWKLEDQGGPCYQSLIDLLGSSIVQPDGFLDKKRIGAMTFPDPDLMKKVNAIVHPVVKEAAAQEAVKAEAEGYDWFFFEAALMFESTCDEVFDEVWYVFSPKEERVRRLMRDRGYSRKKAEYIMSLQLSDRAFRAKADRVIRNDGDPAEVYRELDVILGELQNS